MIQGCVQLYIGRIFLYNDESLSDGYDDEEERENIVDDMVQNK